MSTEVEFREQMWNQFFAESTTACLYSVFDKLRDRFAGIVSLSSTDPSKAATEMGMIIIPTSQRTYVATNAAGLMLCWLLDAPSASGLGLRRVVWRSHSGNMASRGLASRIGFELEGIARWQRVVHGPRVGVPADALAQRNGRLELPGEHTAVYSMVWDEWIDKRSTLIEKMMYR